jgi:hypothetical protein
MKVLDLQCAQQHVFEGWFVSEDDFQSQCTDLLIECPLCGDTRISKRLSAPRLNLGSHAQPKSDVLPVAPTKTESAMTLQEIWLAAVHHVMSTTDDVGSDFTREARRIHYGEVPERAIRGSATHAQTEELIEEGIAVIPISLPEVLKKTLQ